LPNLQLLGCFRLGGYQNRSGFRAIFAGHLIVLNDPVMGTTGALFTFPSKGIEVFFIRDCAIHGIPYHKLLLLFYYTYHCSSLSFGFKITGFQGCYFSFGIQRDTFYLLVFLPNSLRPEPVFPFFIVGTIFFFPKVVGYPFDFVFFHGASSPCKLQLVIVYRSIWSIGSNEPI